MPNAERGSIEAPTGTVGPSIRDDGQVLVLYEPNAASGGRPSPREVDDFRCGMLTGLSTPSCSV